MGTVKVQAVPSPWYGTAGTVSIILPPIQDGVVHPRAYYLTSEETEKLISDLQEALASPYLRGE